MAREKTQEALSLSYLPAEKLGSIPVGYHAQHEFCFYVHDTLLNLLREADASHIRSITVELTPAEQSLLQANPDDPIGALLQTSKRAEGRRVLLNHAILALCADMLHFIYESLTALSKRKFAVSLGLLRKPFQESILYLSWILANEDEFFSKFEAGPSSGMDSSRIKPRQRIGIFDKAIESLTIEKVFNAEHLHMMIFDKSQDAGLAQLFDKAIHLITTYHPQTKTEALNFNFIFKNPEDDDIFPSIYPNVSYVLMYMFSVVAALFARVLPIEKAYVSRIVLVMFGAYHALFCKGASPVMAAVRRAFRDLMTCPVCKRRFKVSKREAARFLVGGRARCQTCGAEFDFPVLWLMAQAGFSATKSE